MRLLTGSLTIRDSSNDDGARISSFLAGIFAFLDATLNPGELAEAKAFDFAPRTYSTLRPCIRVRISDLICEVFRLQYRHCPLRDALAPFRLYHRDDMADALAMAYFRHLKSLDPLEALSADYGLKRDCILKRVDLDALLADKGEDGRPKSWIWKQVAYHYQQGDAVVRYRTPPSSGMMILRSGDRLVWEEEEFRFCIMGVSARWRAELARYNELGGHRAYLAGKFEWPDPTWINPVTDEEERAALGKGFRGNCIPDGTS